MHPLLRTALRQSVRYGTARALSGAGPRTGTDLRGAADLTDEVVQGERPPTPVELLGRRTTAVGRFATVDPLVAPGWPRRRARTATLVGWGAVALAVGRRRWRG